MSPLVIELRAGEGGRDAEAFCGELAAAITAIRPPTRRPSFGSSLTAGIPDPNP